MSDRRARIALGHLATAAVVGTAGLSGAVGPWWVPVTIGALVAGAIAVASRQRQARAGATQLSGMAAVLDSGVWSGPAVAHQITA